MGELLPTVARPIRLPRDQKTYTRPRPPSIAVSIRSHVAAYRTIVMWRQVLSEQMDAVSRLHVENMRPRIPAVAYSFFGPTDRQNTKKAALMRIPTTEIKPVARTKQRAGVARCGPSPSHVARLKTAPCLNIAMVAL